MKEKRSSAAVVALLLLSFFFAAKAASYYLDAHRSRQLSRELEMLYRQEEEELKGDPGASSTGGLSEEDKAHRQAELLAIRFERLQGVNPDIKGWISLPGTAINYPILQAADNDYYLRRDPLGRWALRGSIYADAQSPLDAHAPTVLLYGHHMKDGSMFGDLVRFGEEDFAREHNLIQTDFPDGSVSWQVYSAYVYRVEDHFLQASYASLEDYERFIGLSLERSRFDAGLTLDGNDAILTLLTCSYDDDDARFVVHAKRLDK